MAVGNYQDLQEAELVEIAKADFNAFAILYQKYLRRVYSYVYGMVHSHETAEDIVSQTFEKALRNIGSYEQRGFSFGAWLYRIAYHQTLDYLRHNSRLTPFSDESVYIDEGNLALEDQVLSAQTLSELQQLDELSQTVVTLRYLEGYSIREVAQIMEKSEDAVKSLAKRALVKLRKALVVTKSRHD